MMQCGTRRALTWRGCLTAFGLGALLLAPALALAQGRIRVEEKEDGAASAPKVVIVGDDDDLNPGKTDLLELEAQLAQKQAETAAFAARVAAIRAKLKARQAAESKAKRNDGDERTPLVVNPAGPNGNSTALADLLKQLQARGNGAAPPGMIVLDEGTGKIVVRLVGENTPAPAAADADKRIDELETKLKDLLDEVEKLRRERKPDAPEASPDPNLHSYGTPILEKIPYIKRLFKTMSPAAAQEERARAMAEEAAARQQAEAAAAELRKRTEDSAAKLEALSKQLEQTEALLKQTQDEKERAEVEEQSARAEAARLKKVLEDILRAKEVENKDKKPSEPESKGSPQ